MFREMLAVQWRSSRLAIAVLVVAAFAAPLAVVSGGGGLDRASGEVIVRWLATAEVVGYAMPVLALMAGVLAGTGAWAADQAGHHVYALSLPLPRPTYVLLRFAAGGSLLLLPVAALGVGALIAALAVSLPVGLHAYPLQLTGRFGLAVLGCYAIFFALSSATRRVVLAMVGLAGGLALAQVLLALTGSNDWDVLAILEALARWPGPLAILTGRWALIDV